MRRPLLCKLAVTLLGAAVIAIAHAQAPQAPATEGQARYYVYGAFLTHAVPEIIGERIALGPELEQRLGLASSADRQTIYDALMIYTDGKPLRVRKATVEEIARYKVQAKRELKDPIFTVQAGDIALLVEYDTQANAIPFVGQLGVAYQPPVAAPRAVPVPPPPPVATVAPKPKPASARVPPPPPAEVLKANGPCVVRPVMSEQDLANCRAAPGGSARVQPGPPLVVKQQAAMKPEVSPAPRRAAACEVKPVMSEEDLANCRAAPGGSARVQPGPPIVVKPQARIEPAPQPQRTGPCEVKPVMSEEDLANCRNAPGGAARVQPGPPPVAARPATKPEPTPKPAAAPCVVKPVMSEEDLAACAR